jgi:tRNA A37 threonylcarbamoyladenosine synthetase subunit TsaC/SUA5/YrdC
MNDPALIRERFEHALAAVVDAGACALQATTVLDLTPMGEGGDPEVIREGAGDLAALGL